MADAPTATAGVFRARDRRDATSAIAPVFAAGPSTGFAENFAAEREAQIQVDNSASRMANLGNAYDPIIAALNEGRPLRRRFANPIGRTINDPLFGPTQRAAIGGEALEEMIWSAVREARASDPSAFPDLPASRDDMLSRIRERAIEANEISEDVSARRTGAGAVGGFAGRVSGAIIDPPNFVTLGFGAPASWGIIRTALFEGMLNASVETLLQPEVQAYRIQLGLSHGSDEAARNILYAGAGGALFGGGIKALGQVAGPAVGAVTNISRMSRRELLRQYDRLVSSPTPEQRTARDTAEQTLQAEADSPLAETGTATAEHLERLAVAQDSAETLEVPPVPDRPAAPIRETVEADNLEGIIFSFDPEELQIDARTFQFKEGGDEFGVTERLQGVTEFDPIKAGHVIVWEREDGTRFVADGHQRAGLARRITATTGARTRLFGQLLREADGVTAAEARVIAAAKNIAEGTGSAIDAAKILRGGLSDAALPPRSALVRTARELTNLSDDAFGMVINDVVPANFAALVGRLVSDQDFQGAVLELLTKTEPANATQAEAIIRQALEAPRSSETTLSLFGEEEVVQSLFLERAKVLDRAIRLLRRDRSVFNTLVRDESRIADAGNVLNRSDNQRRAIADAQALETLQRIANRRGPLSDALDAAARRAKEEGRFDRAAGEFVGSVRSAVERGDFEGASLRGDRSAGDVAAENRRRAQEDARLDSEQSKEFDEPDSRAVEVHADQIQNAIEDTLRASARASLPPDIPRTVYRGHGRADRASVYQGPAEPIMGDGLYYAFDRKTAEGFGPEIEERAVDFSKPLIIRGGDEWRELTKAAGWDFPNPFGLEQDQLRRQAARLQEVIKERGHDAVVIHFDPNLQADFDGAGRNIKTLRNVFGEPQVFVPGARPRGGLSEPPAAPLTPEGGQALIPGVEPVTDRARLAVEAGRPLRGGDEPAGGLFDENARAQTDLLDEIETAARAEADDLAVPIGAAVDDAGDQVPVTATARDLLDDLDRDKGFVEALETCLK